MLTLKKVAVTGGLASGKSSVCGFFKELGAYVVDADEIVHQLLSPHTSIGLQVIALLGEEILVDGQLDRSRIAKKVFHDQRLLLALQNILHPAVMTEIDNQYQNVKNQGQASLFVAEIPLLFEIGAEKFFNFTITVKASAGKCLERFGQRTASSTACEVKTEFENRMRAQLPLEEKMRRADHVIDNSGSLSSLRRSIAQIYQDLLIN
jgi:dephospho-CoA kinase